MRRYHTEPSMDDVDRLRHVMASQGFDFDQPSTEYVAGYVGRILGDLHEHEDPHMARRIAHGKALIESLRNHLGVEDEEADR